MASLVGLLHRNWQLANPPIVRKNDNPLRFGILGAADIAPLAIIIPAKTHPDVIIQAVAARDRERATAYAKKYGIPEVKTSYQDILDDPNIDCVYIPLPCGLHYEWSLKALKAGKHVLVEKPCFNNTTECESIYHHDAISPSQGPAAPVLLEAVHYLFHPAWTKFMDFVSPQDVVKAEAYLGAPRGMFKNDNIRFRYELAGGALMDLGCYTSSALVRIFGGLAESCEEAIVDRSPYDSRCDRGFRVKYHFPGEAVGDMNGDLQAPLLGKFWPSVEVQHRPVLIPAADAGVDVSEGHEVARTRRVKFINFVAPHLYHFIQVDDEFAIRKTGDVNSVVRSWKKTRTLKFYNFREGGIDQDGEVYWSTYRYQLEQFVNKTRGRQPSHWVNGEESTDTLRMVDMAYTTANLPLRPTSEYR
ncbi:hypothetical protein PFICI_06001 [Pestalotiopsis fici W106-1]|uniref:D-xylose 1-dehydrogenase (NADP(+), D-xylono-1,5-lactone-forming) n=1 Tax=Pestalotiopsis fici (strain W106-1 / CGMCC3.15140) TaxID=1229662 RepID=W3X4R3_PESFW|nr:uncharacterized protein PFICI_06001 [Pestalotiopsis fici W106-1]ETS80999.1 hypothetical protein PFICI_06001 [Pestalotiopsis fici W106-1]